MSTILPSALPIQAAQVAGQVLSPLTVTDAASQAALAALDAGTVIEAQVQGKDASGQIVLATSSGEDLTLAAKGAAAELLAQGASVEVQVVTTSLGQPALRLLAVNDQAVARPLSLPSLTAPALTLPGAPTVLIDSGGTLTGQQTAQTTAQSVPTAQSSPAQSSPTQASLGLVATMLRPASAAVAAPQDQVAGPGAPSSPALGQVTVPGQTGGLPSNLPVGTTVAVRILEVSQVAPVPSESLVSVGEQGVNSAQPVPVADKSAPVTETALVNDPSTVAAEQPVVSDSHPPVLDGKIVSVIPGQRATVATPVGLLSLPAIADLKEQALVRLEVVSAPLPPADEPPLDQTADPIRTVNADLAQLIADGAPQMAQKLLSMLPQLDGKLAANLSLFVKAMDKQSGRTKLDDDSVEDVGKAGGKAMAARLAGAFRQLETQTGDHEGQDGVWNGFTVPLATGDLIQPVQFFIRQPPQDQHRIDPDGHQDNSGGGVSKTRDQRFLVELMLSRLGRLQMDGLVQRADKRFDLIVRTKQPLTKVMRNDITDLFITTTEAAGSRGSVTFQAGGRFVAVAIAADHTKLSI